MFFAIGVYFQIFVTEMKILIILVVVLIAIARQHGYIIPTMIPESHFEFLETSDKTSQKIITNN